MRHKYLRSELLELFLDSFCVSDYETLNIIFAVVLKEEKPVKHEKEASILGNKNQMDTGDVQEVSKNDFGVSDNIFFCCGMILFC